MLLLQASLVIITPSRSHLPFTQNTRGCRGAWKPSSPSSSSSSPRFIRLFFILYWACHVQVQVQVWVKVCSNNRRVENRRRAAACCQTFITRRAVQFSLFQIIKIPCSSFPPPQVDEIYHDESLGTNINIVLVRMIMVGYRQVRLGETNNN